MTTTATPQTASTAYAIDRTHSEVLFRVRHLLSRVSGQFRDFSGSITFDPARPENARVAVGIKAASIDTAVADRDGHLKSADFFDVENHPEITFVSDRVVSKGADNFAVGGTLTIRGVARQIELPVTYLGVARDPWGNDKLGFEASIRLNRKEFGLTWNAALETGGFLVGDDVDVTLNVQAARAN
ncbi:MAG: YceI family protein [Acidobacteria bacterium]|nr:YceI family protein [Acidobacteriota bacterium]